MDACKQRLYTSQAVAAQQATQENLPEGQSKGMHRPYYCLRCGGWHIALIIKIEGERLGEATEPKIAALGLPDL